MLGPEQSLSPLHVATGEPAVPASAKETAGNRPGAGDVPRSLSLPVLSTRRVKFHLPHLDAHQPRPSKEWGLVLNSEGQLDACVAPETVLESSEVRHRDVLRATGQVATLSAATIVRASRKASYTLGIAAELLEARREEARFQRRLRIDSDLGFKFYAIFSIIPLQLSSPFVSSGFGLSWSPLCSRMFLLTLYLPRRGRLPLLQSLRAVALAGSQVPSLRLLPCPHGLKLHRRAVSACSCPPKS